MAIAQTLETATPALDFEIPLESGDPRFVDFAAVRGGGSVKRLRERFMRQKPDQWLHVAFASHRGAGKTTELKRLAADLNQKYYAIYFEASIEMNAVNFEMEDLLLVIGRLIEERFRERGTPIPRAELATIEKWFAESVFTDEGFTSYLGTIQAEARAEGGIPFFAKLTSALTATLKRSSEHKEQIKRQVKKFPGALLAHVNNLLQSASRILEDEGLRLLLLIDNMDRYKPQAIDELLVASQDVFKGLMCHLIVTPPIDLVFRPQTQAIRNVFLCETMPTVKLREPHQGYWEFSGDGRDKLLQALANRINLDRLIPDPDHRDRLVAASGGGIRELLNLAQDASLDAAGDTITREDVDTTLRRWKSVLRAQIDACGWWEALASIATTKRVTEDSKQQDVVFQRLAFQYNGEIWYDVSPLVADLLQEHVPDLLKPPAKKTARQPAAQKKAADKKKAP